jgi:hypothetical protein
MAFHPLASEASANKVHSVTVSRRLDILAFRLRRLVKTLANRENNLFPFVFPSFFIEGSHSFIESCLGGGDWINEELAILVGS